MTSDHPQFEPTAFSRPLRGEGRFALGVCAGLSRRWGVDVGLLRVVAFFGVLSVVGGLAYLAAAAVMPVEGEDDAVGTARSGLGRAILAAVRLAGWLIAAALLAFAGGSLTLFGLPAVVLGGALLLVVAGLATRHRVPALAPVPLLAVAFTLPAAYASTTGDRVDRSFGDLVYRAPDAYAGTLPSTTTLGPYRRGAGEVLVDLRRYRPAPGSTTRIKAQSDLGRVVVALPRDRCFSLRVRTKRLSGTVQRLFGAGMDTIGHYDTDIGRGDDYAGNGAGALSTGVSVDQEEADVAPGYDDAKDTIWLSAYGRTVFTNGSWSRPAPGRPDAPTIELDLTSAAAAVVRDYPAQVEPLEPFMGTGWPLNTPDQPLSPETQDPSAGRSNRSPANRERWRRWESQGAAWAQAQAKRFAGACATRAELATRWEFDPATLEPWDESTTPVREVNGLGDSRVVTDGEDYR